MIQWLRICLPNAGGLGSIPGQGTQSHMWWLRAHIPWLKVPHMATKTWSSQIEKKKKVSFHFCFSVLCNFPTKEIGQSGFEIASWFFNNFIYDLFLVVLGLRCCPSFSPASRGHSSLQCMGFSLQWLLIAEHGFYSALASAVVACGLMSCGSPAGEHRLSIVAFGLPCSAACGTSPDQESNPCLLHWQADSLPLSHQGSPLTDIFGQSSQNRLTKSA